MSEKIRKFLIFLVGAMLIVFLFSPLKDVDMLAFFSSIIRGMRLVR